MRFALRCGWAPHRSEFSHVAQGSTAGQQAHKGTVGQAIKGSHKILRLVGVCACAQSRADGAQLDTAWQCMHMVDETVQLWSTSNPQVSNVSSLGAVTELLASRIKIVFGAARPKCNCARTWHQARLLMRAAIWRKRLWETAKTVVDYFSVTCVFVVLMKRCYSPTL